MKKNAVSILAVLALFVALLIGGAGLVRTAKATDASAKPSFRDSITVTGEGKVFAPSDEATISFGVRTVRSTASRAMGDNSIATNKTIDALRGQGLTDEEIKTGNISLFPQQDWREGRAPQIISYTAENRIIIKTKKLDKLGAIIDSATKSGATDVSELRFQLSEDNAAKQEALKIAVKNARKKAEALAKELGVNVGKPIVLSEGVQPVPVVPYRDELVMRAEFANDKAMSTPVMPQDIQVNAEVSVSFTMN